MRKYIFSGTILLLFLSFLIYNHEVVTGAAQGLLLWYRFVLPSLLPFMILVNIMMYTDTISLLAKMLGPFMKGFPGVSPAGSFAVLTGFLCGYPMGAKVSADLVKNRQITCAEGAYLLSFCNNTSPMFVLSILLTQYVPDQQLHPPFFLILFLSPLLTGQLFRIYYTQKNPASFRRDTLPVKNPGAPKQIGFLRAMDTCLTDSFQAIIKVGLYMMLFAIFIRLSARLIPGSCPAKPLLLSSMEITSGLSILARLKLPASARYILLIAQTSFGGFCAVFQTASMIQKSGLKILPYVIEKLITATVTSLLTFLYLCL